MDGNVLFNDNSTHLLFGCMDGWMEMFYLTMHSTHFYMVIWMDGNVLFNDTLNTFIIWLYGWKCYIFIWLYGWMDGNVLFNDTLNTFLYG